MLSRRSGILLELGLLSLLVLPASAETVYFVVGVPGLYEQGLGDSYILPLSDPNDIQQARSLRDSGGGAAIAVALVTKGSGGINRDWVAEGRPPWSWHVLEFQGFTEFAIELCDGTPTFTEAEAGAWEDGANIQICYWNYRVLEEVVVSDQGRSSWGRIKALY